MYLCGDKQQKVYKKMAAKDYQICLGLGNAYIAKTSKRNPGVMLDDRRVIEEHEICALIDWWLHKKIEGKETDTATITGGGEPIIEVKLLKKEDKE